MKHIYAIWDNAANEQASMFLYLFPNDAPAIRTFQDVASMPDSTIGKHLGDYDLVCLGTLDGTTITPEHRIVLAGRVLDSMHKETK